MSDSARHVALRGAACALMVCVLGGRALATPAHEHGGHAEHGDAQHHRDSAPLGAPVFLYDPPAPGTYELPPIRRAFDFTVRDSASDRSVRLNDLRGNAVLLSFIYTSCPDPNMCPLTVTTIGRVRRTLAERGLGKRARFVTVTIDLARDTPEALRRYASLAKAEGSDWLFAAPESVEAAKPFFAAYDLHPRPAPDGTITHTLRTYLIDPAGVVRQIYLPSYFDPRVVTNDLETVLRERPSG